MGDIVRGDYTTLAFVYPPHTSPDLVSSIHEMVVGCAKGAMWAGGHNALLSKNGGIRWTANGQQNGVCICFVHGFWWTAPWCSPW